MSEFGIAEREKERIKYCEMLFACVEKLNTDENINDSEDNVDEDDDDDSEEDGDDDSSCCHQMVPDVPSEPPDNDCGSCGRLMSPGVLIQACKLCGYDKCSECHNKKNKQEETQDR